MWEQIRANKRRARFLLGGMLLVLVLMGFFLAEGFVGRGTGVFGIFAALILWFVQILIYWLSGESILLSGLGAREITRDMSPRLFNIVEEMQIASGLQHFPRIYLVYDPSPNAFSFGRKPEQCAIAVTTGLLYRLNRDELQGVIGHETGHIVNRDTEYMTLAGVTLGSVVILSDMVKQSLRFGVGRTRSRSSSRGNEQAAFLALAIVIAIIGPILVQILYFACSRSREFLADASAAQFTRYPEGLASALERISYAAPELVVNRAVAPMFIVNPLSSADAEPQGLFSTHPPTAERVKILRSMAGASFADYDSAYRAAIGKRSAIGPAALSSAKPEALRAPTEEGPIHSRGDVKAVVQQLYGLMQVTCTCGMKMQVPETYEESTVHCFRCGNVIELPSVKERYSEYFKRQEKPVPAPGKAEYQRKGTGWEDFQCGCGATIQLSPGFSAPHITCTKCHAEIKIIPVAHP
jgi:heat shock protein HtpX